MLFDKYKNTYNGVAYVIGSGSSLLSFKEQEPGIYVGANRCYYNKLISKKLDFLFIESPTTPPECEVISDKITIFARHNAYPGLKSKPNAYFAEHNSDYHSIGVPRSMLYPGMCSSTIFYCFQFCVYMGCKKIYIVGCDCTIGDKFYPNKEYVDNYASLVSGWQWLKKFAIEKIPDIEIIIINPVNPQMKQLFPSIEIKTTK